MTDSWRQVLDETIDRHFDKTVALRRHLHQNPEPSGEEFETSLYLYQKLSDSGFQVQMGPEGCGVIADQATERNAATPLLALRADIDALQIHDEKNRPYRSQRDGVMHACGHDAHTAIVFTALEALSELTRRQVLPWPIHYRGIFQPAEETCKGALQMIEAGALDQVDGILGLHVDPNRPVDHIGIRNGVMTANCDEMRIVVTGRGGHAARPHEAADPIAAALQLVNSLYLYIPRATDSQDAVVLTIGQIQGGHHFNVIPEMVVLAGTLRTLDEEVRQQTIEHIRRIAIGVARSAQIKIDVEFLIGPKSVVNDSAFVTSIHSAAEEVLGSVGVETMPRPSMGGEDFSFYLQHIPGAMFRLGTASSSCTTGLHTPTFDIEEEIMKTGAKIMARTAVLWTDPHRITSETTNLPD